MFEREDYRFTELMASKSLPANHATLPMATTYVVGYSATPVILVTETVNPATSLMQSATTTTFLTGLKPFTKRFRKYSVSFMCELAC